MDTSFFHIGNILFFKANLEIMASTNKANHQKKNNYVHFRRILIGHLVLF